MRTFNMIALAILGGQLASAGWMGAVSCDTAPYQGVSSSQSCATAIWTEYRVYEYDAELGDWRYVQYPVLFQEEMSFRTSGFSTLSVHQRNQPAGVFELPEHGGLYFSSMSAYFLEVIRIYVPGVPGDYWVEVDWRLDDSGDGEFDFHSFGRLDGNELQVDAYLDVISGSYSIGYPHPQNQDLTFEIERIRLIDQRTHALLTGYYYTSGPEPGVMVGGTLWTPEPATFGLAACALFALALWRRRVGC
ncbi:MAG: hypothetical protein NTV70_11730 [Acidobacteria bacterium]|nr:hypothetical protein [Acidobacteriota bacterium]